MSCVLVGNGTSLLDRETGPEIDSHETIVRFNHCKISGFEKHVGTKTHVWFTVMQHEKRLVAPLAPLRTIYVHTWNTPQRNSAVWKSYEGLPVPREVVERGILKEMKDFMEGEGYWHWSTGALAIWIMLKTEPLVNLIGFDWWERDAHHYCDKAVRGSTHKPEIEKKLIDKLASQGRLSFL